MPIDFSKHKKGDVVRVHCCDSCARAAGVQPKCPPDSGSRSWPCEVCGHWGIGSATDCTIGDWLILHPNKRLTEETSNARGEWVLVPRVPTEAMISHGEEWEYSTISNGPAMARQLYAAMLAAAPSPAATPQQPAAVDEAMVERAWVAFCENNGSARQGIRAALIAALTGEQ